MANHRSILALILAFVAAFVVSCGSPSEAKVPTYTPTQLEKIQGDVSGIDALRDRMPELATMIQNRDWNNVESFIHGPLGELRFKLNTVARELLPNAQKPALDKAKEVFTHFNELDEAAQKGSYDAAIRSYAKAIQDFDAYLALPPKASA